MAHSRCGGPAVTEADRVDLTAVRDWRLPVRSAAPSHWGFGGSAPDN